MHFDAAIIRRVTYASFPPYLSSFLPRPFCLSGIFKCILRRGSSGFLLVDSTMREKKRRGFSPPLLNERGRTMSPRSIRHKCIPSLKDSWRTLFHEPYPSILPSELNARSYSEVWMQQNQLELTLINPEWEIWNVMCSMIMDLFWKLSCDNKFTSFIIYNSLLVLSIILI